MEEFNKYVTEVSKILETIERQENSMLISVGGKVELAPAGMLSDAITKIAVLLGRVVDPLYDADLLYRQTKAAKRDSFLKEGMKKSPAKDELEYDPELMQMGNFVRRAEAHVQRCEQIIMTVQSKMKVQAKNL